MPLSYNPTRDFGTPQQVARVEETVALPHYRGAVGLQYHESDTPRLTRKRPHIHLWYDTEDNLHCDRISTNGRYLNRVVAKSV
jgi:hypothetical protein